MLSIQTFPPSGLASASKSTSKSESTITPTPTSKQLCTPNLLPCRIHHDGPVNASRRHWDPQIGQGTPEKSFHSISFYFIPRAFYFFGPGRTHGVMWSLQLGNRTRNERLKSWADGEPTAYFRGRKLKGKEVRVPDGYRGLVVGRKRVEGEQREIGDRWKAGYGNDAGGEGQEDEGEEEVAVLEELATFEEVIVWDHEKVVEDDDGVVKGLEEWIRFAAAMHASGAPQN